MKRDVKKQQKKNITHVFTKNIVSFILLDLFSYQGTALDPTDSVSHSGRVAQVLRECYTVPTDHPGERRVTDRQQLMDV